MSLTEPEKELLYALQCGLPLTRRPFAALGDEFGFSEKETVAFVARLFADGLARRLGGVFNARMLGYRSSLCAVSLPNDTWVEAVATVLVPHPSVTHCHERAWPRDLDWLAPGSPQGKSAPNLWFTCTAPRRQLDRVLLELRERVSPADLQVMPAQTCFKFDEVYDPRTKTRKEGSLARLLPEHHLEEDPDFTDAEQDAVRLLQRNLPPAPDLFAQAASALGMSLDDMLDLLRSWRENGMLRRFGLMLRHENLGYQASGMGVWTLPASQVRSSGHCLAAFPQITHCYERTVSPEFPYNLTAMIHGPNWGSVCASFVRMSNMADLKEGRLLCSVREFKNTCPRFFMEDTGVEEPDEAEEHAPQSARGR
jgi:DNA-binding Lrp family transcriptional regulator